MACEYHYKMDTEIPSNHGNQPNNTTENNNQEYVNNAPITRKDIEKLYQMLDSLEIYDQDEEKKGK